MLLGTKCLIIIIPDHYKYNGLNKLTEKQEQNQSTILLFRNPLSRRFESRSILQTNMRVGAKRNDL